MRQIGVTYKTTLVSLSFFYAIIRHHFSLISVALINLIYITLRRLGVTY
jgi:hypothetical protein